MKTKLKKETLETEIELLENHIKLKRQELRHSCTSLTDDYDANASNRLSCSVDNQFKNKNQSSSKNCYNMENQKTPFTYEEVIFLKD